MKTKRRQSSKRIKFLPEDRHWIRLQERVISLTGRVIEDLTSDDEKALFSLLDIHEKAALRFYRSSHAVERQISQKRLVTIIVISNEMAELRRSMDPDEARESETLDELRNELKERLSEIQADLLAGVKIEPGPVLVWIEKEVSEDPRSAAQLCTRVVVR